MLLIAVEQTGKAGGYVQKGGSKYSAAAAVGWSRDLQAADVI